MVSYRDDTEPKTRNVHFAQRILVMSSVTIAVTTSILCLMLVFAVGEKDTNVLPILAGSMVFLVVPFLLRMGAPFEVARETFFGIMFVVLIYVSLDPKTGLLAGFIGYVPIFICISGMMYRAKGILIVALISLVIIGGVGYYDINRLPVEHIITTPASVIATGMRQSVGIVFAVMLVLVAAKLYEDIVERLRDARDRARTASMSKSTFLANVSHEVRTPLNAIIGMAEILKVSDLSADQRRKVDTISESGTALLEMLNDILDISRLEANQMPVTPSRQEVTALFNGIERLWAPIAEEKGLQFVSQIADNLPEAIEIDAQRLRQCLNNLLSNALKFTAVGRIKMDVHWDDRPGSPTKLVVNIHDSGIGMSPDAANRVFAPFGQADDTISRSYGGTGLGLTITRNLSRIMGGDLRFKSVQDHGSIFTLVVTAVALQAEAPRVDTAKALARGQRVLVVDDIPTNRMVAATYIRAMAGQVTEASSGDQAINLIRNQQFDLILLDLHMPSTDGLWVLERLASIPTQTPPVVVMTAGANEEEIARALALGAREVLIKPLTPSVLETLMRALAA